MFNSLISICWLVFMIFWVISGWGAKKNIRGNNQQAGPCFNLIIITVTIFILFNIPVLRQFRHYHIFPSTHLIQAVGVFICASGIAFSIWAKIHLGKNWGMPMAMKEKPDLVMTGPYAFIRHPIYTGISLAILGSMVTVGFTWLIWFILSGSYFIYCAIKEEKRMLLQFPTQYHKYMKRTKMFIPFVY